MAMPALAPVESVELLEVVLLEVSSELLDVVVALLLVVAAAGRFVVDELLGEVLGVDVVVVEEGFVVVVAVSVDDEVDVEVVDVDTVVESLVVETVVGEAVDVDVDEIDVIDVVDVVGKTTGPSTAAIEIAFSVPQQSVTFAPQHHVVVPPSTAPQGVSCAFPLLS